MLQCHNIVNSKMLLLQFLSYVQETKYCVAGKQADIIPDSKIINCKQTKLLFLIKISWLVFKRKGLKSYKFNSKTKTNAKTNALYKIILLFRICFKSCSISKFQLQSAISLWSYAWPELTVQSTDTIEHLVTFDRKVNFISVTTE